MRIQRFLISRFVAALADQFMLFAVPLAILKSTGSVKYSGLAFAIEWLPRLILFPVSGTIADKLNPRRIFIVSDLLRFALVTGAAFLLAQGGGHLFWVLSLMMAVLAVANSFCFVAMEATLPRELTAAELPKAHSMLQGTDQISQIVGPALAALATQFLSLEMTLGVGALLFLTSAINMIGVKLHSYVETKRPDFRELAGAYHSAWNILVDNPILFQLCALTWIVNLVYAAALVVSPAVVVQVFHLPESHYGALQTIAGVTSVAMFFVLPRITRRIGLPSLGITAFSAMILSALLMATSVHPAMYLVGYVVLLAFDGAFNVYIRSLRGQIIPKAHMGKTTGLIIMINNSSLPITGWLVAQLSSFFTPMQTLGAIFALSMSLGVCMLAVGKRKFGYPTLVPSLAA